MTTVVIRIYLRAIPEEQRLQVFWMRMTVSALLTVMDGSFSQFSSLAGVGCVAKDRRGEIMAVGCAS